MAPGPSVGLLAVALALARCDGELYTGPDTGALIEILWDVPAKWSAATITHYAPGNGSHTAQYDSPFTHSAALEPGRWRRIPAHTPEAAAESLPTETAHGQEHGEALVGTRVYVKWDPYQAWHPGEVGGCTVRGGRVTTCSVSFDDGMGTHDYDLSAASATRWRRRFTPDPEAWSLPRSAAFFDAPNFMELDVDPAVIARVRRWYELHVVGHLGTRADTFASSAACAAHDPNGACGAAAPSFFRQFAGGKFGSDIKWISAADLPTHERMAAFYDELRIAPRVERFVDGGKSRVFIPSFVVRASVSRSYYHTDWAKGGQWRMRAGRRGQQPCHDSRQAGGVGGIGQVSRKAHATMQ